MDFHVRTLVGDSHFQPDRLALHVARLDVKKMVTPHDHDFLELVLIDKGRAEHITSSRRVLTSAGDVWVIKPGRWHTYMGVRGLSVYNCLIGPELIQALAPLVRGEPGAVELLWRGPAVQAGDGCLLLRLPAGLRLEAQRLLEEMIRCRDASRPGSDLSALGYLTLFIGLLSRAALEGSGSTKKGKDVAKKSASSGGVSINRVPAVVDAIQMLEERFAEPHTATGLASTVGLSASHLRRAFRQLTGQSPMQYLAGVRVQRACRLLVDTNRSITEIAGAVGWPDPNLFARRFREHLGVSPRAYRQSHTRPSDSG